MSRAEIDATINLLKYVPGDVVESIKMAASVHGMGPRSPHNHSSLARPELRSGYQSNMESSEYSENMINTNETVRRIIDRVHREHSAASVGWKPVDKIQESQKLCSCFEWALRLLQADLPADTYAAHVPELLGMFSLGVMDETLVKITAEQKEPFDIKEIPEFKAIYDRLRRDIEAEQLNKKKALRLQVDSATLESLQLDVTSDVRNAVEYERQLASKKNSWSARVTSYKRARHMRGISTTRDQMRSYMNISRSTQVAQGDTEIGYVKGEISSNKITNGTETNLMTDLALFFAVGHVGHHRAQYHESPITIFWVDALLT